jgi:hypothetical protein
VASSLCFDTGVSNDRHSKMAPKEGEKIAETAINSDEKDIPLVN